jgi:hypothetical protein
MSDGTLNDKQQRFVEEYLIDLNASKAAIRAGYSRATAEAQASRLLAHVGIAAAIEAGKIARGARTEVTKEYLVEQLQNVFRVAIEERHFAGAARLGELLGKLNGHIIERRDVRLIKRVEDLTDEELAAVTATAEAERSSEGTRH